MAYSVEITNGAATFTFDVEPSFKPDYSYEWDNSKSPAELTAIVETWLLEDATTTGVASDVTDHLQTLLTLAENVSQPVNSVKFKRDGNTVFEMNTTTHRSVQFHTIKPKVGPGTWQNHLQYDVVIVGRKDTPDGSGIVKLEMEKSYEADAAGLLKVSVRGKVRTSPGTSAKTQAEAQALASPGAAFGIVTQGDGDSGVNVVVMDHPDDTEASFESTYQEFGVSLPTGVEEYELTEEVSFSPEGKTTTITVKARGSSNTNATSAVNAQEPDQGLSSKRVTTDQARLGVSGTFTKHEVTDEQKSRYAQANILLVTISLSVTGGGRRKVTRAVPGFFPVAFVTPLQPVRVTENVTVRSIGATPSEFIPAPLAPDHLEDGSVETPAHIVKVGMQRTADEWERTARREYVFTSPAEAEQVVRDALASQTGVPQYATDPDFLGKSTASHGA